MSKKNPSKENQEGYCFIPKITGRPLSRPHLGNCNDLAVEGAKIYRLYRAGFLKENHYRACLHGIKVLRDLLRDQELTDLSLQIDTIKEAIQHKNDEQEKVKDDDNNQQPNEE